jgi:hypothetical protein
MVRFTRPRRTRLTAAGAFAALSIALAPGAALAQGLSIGVPRPPAAVAPRPPATASEAEPSRPLSPQPPTVSSAAIPAFSLTQTGSGYTAENLRFAIGPAIYVVPRAEIRGTSLSKDELASLLDPKSAVPIAERVRRLAASEITAAEIRAEVSVPAGRQLAVYRDIRVAQIGSGRIASVTAQGGTFDNDAKEGNSRGGFTRLEVADIDVGLAASLFEAPASGSPPAELGKVYGSFSVEGITSDGPNTARARIARLAGRDFKAKPTPDGWIATASRLAGPTDLNTAPPEVRGRVIGGMLDLLEAFEIGSLEATGIEFEEAQSKDSGGRIARMSYGSSPRGGGEFRVEGLEASGAGGRFRLASFSMGGISLGSTLAAARELAGARAEDMSAADMRRLVPFIGAIRFSGIEAETRPDGAKPEDRPMRFSIGSVELLGDKPVENIPSDLRFGIRNVSTPIAPDARDDTAKQLAELGYDRLDASLTADLGWNEPGQEIVIREISAQGAGMGRVIIRGLVGNVSRDIFNPDGALASVALVGAAAKSLDVTVENGGLFERILAREARRQSRGPDDLRREWGMAAAVAIPILLGGSPQSKILAQAVARFVAKPGRLSIQARSKDRGGLGFTDYAIASDPLALLEQVEITATAE